MWSHRPKAQRSKCNSGEFDFVLSRKWRVCSENCIHSAFKLAVNLENRLLINGSQDIGRFLTDGASNAGSYNLNFVWNNQKNKIFSVFTSWMRVELNPDAFCGIRNPLVIFYGGKILFFWWNFRCKYVMLQWLGAHRLCMVCALV